MLIHIGIDTVGLGGRGFDPRVKPGTKVQAGDELIRFDLDIVARSAKSLMTPIVVTGDGVTSGSRRAAGPVAAGDVLFEIDLLAAAPSAASAPQLQPNQASASPPRRVAAAGTARPTGGAAGARAKSFSTPIVLAAHDRTADARSVVAIMALGVRHGEELTIQSAAKRLSRPLPPSLPDSNRRYGWSWHMSRHPPRRRRAPPIAYFWTGNLLAWPCAWICRGPRHPDRAPRDRSD